MHAEFFKDFACIGKHIHEVGHWRALIAAHVCNAGLEQGFGDRQDAFALELGARACPQLLHFLLE
ncbi:hypothetical protein [Hydrogenophaga atypica]|uniref:Uncharacterized protein n=1 Tax=Hydrogenophaga atypica TaxID=249409 RepID=A0ABW2QPG5_9BURK